MNAGAEVAARWERLYQTLALLQEVIRAGIAHADTDILVRQAVILDQAFRRAPSTSGYRSAVATTLVAIYDVLSNRVRTAPVDSGGLPIVAGLKWDALSPLAGVLEDIPPFASIDTWTCAMDPQLRRSRPLRRVRFEDDLVVVRTQAPSRLPGPTGRTHRLPRDVLEAPEPSWVEWLIHGAHFVGCASEVLGTILEVFAVELFGSALDAVLTAYEVYDAWSSDEKLAAYNGYLRGFSEAVENMWQPFREGNLATIDQWSAIPYYERQIPSDGLHTSDQAALGYRAGVHRARRFIQDLERQQHNMGKRFLREAASEFGSAHQLRVHILRQRGSPDADLGYTIRFE